MKDSDLLDAPQVDVKRSTAGKWQREYEAFVRLRPSLLGTHLNKYVAVHQQRVVASGDDKIALALRVYAEYGHLPIYAGRISLEPEVPVRIPSPRWFDDHPPARLAARAIKSRRRARKAPEPT